MSSTLQNMPGHRSVETAQAEQGSLLLELFPFLPEAMAGPMPLYATIGLLYVVISRAERRRRRKARQQAGHAVDMPPQKARQPEFQTIGINPQLGPHGGHWGDG